MTPAGSKSWLFDVSPGANHSLIQEDLSFPRVVSTSPALPWLTCPCPALPKVLCHMGVDMLTVDMTPTEDLLALHRPFRLHIGALVYCGHVHRL